MEVKSFRVPPTRDEILSLRAGDIIYVSGELITLRDRTYLKVLEEAPEELEGKVVYHCGPLVRAKGTALTILSAGPTTSTRMEPVILRAVERGALGFIGKGELSELAVERMRGKAFYGLFPGGAGALAASRIVKVKSVKYLDELGLVEAMWVLEVRDFGPVVVAIDAHGNSIFRER